MPVCTGIIETRACLGQCAMSVHSHPFPTFVRCTMCTVIPFQFRAWDHWPRSSYWHPSLPSPHRIPYRRDSDDGYIFSNSLWQFLDLRCCTGKSTLWAAHVTVQVRKDRTGHFLPGHWLASSQVRTGTTLSYRRLRLHSGDLWYSVPERPWFIKLKRTAAPRQVGGPMPVAPVTADRDSRTSWSFNSLDDYTFKWLAYMNPSSTVTSEPETSQWLPVSRS